MPFIESAWVSVHYEVAGTGYPLVLLHGLPLTAESWVLAGYVDALSPRHRCVRVDARGAGESAKSHEPASYALDLYVEDVLAVLDQERVDEFAVWGFSWGGAIGHALAAAYPERVRALVLTGAFGMSPYSLEEIEAMLPLVDKTRSGGMSAMLAAWEPDEDPPLPSWFRDMILDYDPRAWLAARYAGWSWPRVEGDRLTAPTLVIVGEREDPDNEAARWAAGLADGASVMLSGRTHCGAFLAASDSLAAAIPFLTRILDRSADRPSSEQPW